MAKIKVHILNFHSIFSHIDIVLENTSTEPHLYYGINRWVEPMSEWYRQSCFCRPDVYINSASSIYSFEINANPDEITKRYIQYWFDTKNEPSILDSNCAVVAQWFLTEFAGIPKPNLSNISFNHLISGIIWPSFIPCPVTLPGRIMFNAKFHIEVMINPELANKYTRLFLYTCMAISTLAGAASIFAIIVAAKIVSGGITLAAIVGCAAIGAASTYVFFNAHNKLSAKNIADDRNNAADPCLTQEALMQPS